jgi:hypothetical protein
MLTIILFRIFGVPFVMFLAGWLAGSVATLAFLDQLGLGIDSFYRSMYFLKETK